MAIDYDKFPNLHPSIQNGRVLPVRSAYVQYVEGDENGNAKSGAPLISLDGLNTKFVVEENLGNMYPAAQISVCNVKDATRDFLTNYMNFKDQQFNKRLIRLYAGYLQPGQSWKDTPLMFEGNVRFTRFTEPPDIWLNMDVLFKYSSSVLKPQEWGISGTANAEEILTAAAKRLNVGLDIRDMPPNSVRNFTASGDGARLMKQLRDTFPGYAVFISAENKLTTIHTKRTAPAKGEITWSVREDTGMIGQPIVEYWGVELTTLLNPVMHPGDWIKLVSKNQPSASGRYCIRRITHTGELRGSEFYTKIEAYYPDSDKSKK